jgi:hypothetical protein
LAEFFAQIESSGLATWTRESPSLWAYPTILTLHTIGLGIVVGASTVIDLRLLGFAPGIPIPSLRSLFPFIRWAFVLNFLTGVLLFMSDASRKSVQLVFYIKLVLIAVALVSMVKVRKTIDAGEDAAATGLPSQARPWAIASLVLWTGTIIAGRLMAYL